MPAQHVGEPAVPAVALAAEDPQASRDLGPGDRVRDEQDAVAPVAPARQAAHAHDDLHVLADGLVHVAAGGDHRLAPEEAERAGDHEVAAEPVPAEPAGEERAQVLDGLQRLQRTGAARARGMTRPARTSQPLTARIVPPTASTSSSSRNGRIMRCSASASTSVSESIAHTSSPLAASSPTLSASALPPLNLSTTTSAGVRRER